MPILTIAHTKGGVGKSTTTVYLAAAAHARDMSVRVVDLDRQGTTMAWAEAAAAAIDLVLVGVDQLQVRVGPHRRGLFGGRLGLGGRSGGGL